MEATTNEMAHGIDNGNPNSERGCGRDGQRPSLSGTHTTAKARAFYLQLQRRGDGSGGTGESADTEARRAHPDSSAEGSADHKPRLLGSALTCGRFGG